MVMFPLTLYFAPTVRFVEFTNTRSVSSGPSHSLLSSSKKNLTQVPLETLEVPLFSTVTFIIIFCPG